MKEQGINRYTRDECGTVMEGVPDHLMVEQGINRYTRVTQLTLTC
nr:hypothetical protein MACL_00000942 [Theileria orientalis]